MSSSRGRARLGASLLVLAFVLATVVVVAGSVRAQRFYTPDDLGGDGAPVGSVVRLEGRVVAKSPSALILGTDSGSGIGVRVEFDRDPILVRLEPGSTVLVSGVVSAPGLVRQAELLRPSLPSRYKAAADGGS